MQILFATADLGFCTCQLFCIYNNMFKVHLVDLQKFQCWKCGVTTTRPTLSDLWWTENWLGKWWAEISAYFIMTCLLCVSLLPHPSNLFFFQLFCHNLDCGLYGTEIVCCIACSTLHNEALLFDEYFQPCNSNSNGDFIARYCTLYYRYSYGVL